MKKLTLTTLTILFILTSNAVAAAPNLPKMSGQVPFAQDGNCVGKGVREYYKGEFSNAVRIWKPCAKNKGHAMNNLVHMYYYGLGVSQDYKLALKWLKRAKSKGYGSSEFDINGGIKLKALIKVIEVKKAEEDERKAAESKRKAAEYKRIADAKKVEEKRIADAKKSEEKRIADIKKTKETIDRELKKLNANSEKLQNLKLDKLALKANTLISEIENNTYSDLGTLQDFKQRLIKINSDIDKEEKRIADAKKAAEKKKAAELKRITDAKKAEIIAQEKLAEEKKAAEQRRIREEKRIAEEEKRITEEKRIAQEILDKKLALLPPKTELQEAQNFLSDIQTYLASNKDEFDFFEIVKFTKNTKLISEGISDDEQLKNVELFKAFVESSTAFVEFQNNSQNKSCLLYTSPSPRDS